MANTLVKLQKWFLLSAAIILLFTGVVKIASAFQALPLLFADDPILGISYKKIMLYAGSLELLIACFIMLARCNQIKICLVTWLGSCFITYRIFYKAVGVIDPCPCLGVLTAWLDVSRHSANIVLNLFSIYFFGAGIFFLMYELLKRRFNAASPS